MNMNMKSIVECERKKGEKFLNFRLPHYYKKIGWVGFALVFTVLLSTKFFDGDYEVLKIVLKKLSLVFLLLVVFSKEKIEDEMIQKIRAQSFSFAFLGGVLYTLGQPIINYFVFLIATPEKAIVEDLGDFQILWFMLTVYLMFFYVTKKRS